MIGWILSLIPLACAIWVIYNVATKQKSMKPGTKGLWIVLSILFSVITAIVYYFVVYKKK